MYKIRYHSSKTCLLVIVLHFVLMLYCSFSRILAFKASPDLALFHQAFWSMLHEGAPYVTMAQPYERLDWFSWHFSPVFYLFLPFYALFPSPYTLQVLQCLLLSLTAIPVLLTHLTHPIVLFCNSASIFIAAWLAVISNLHFIAK